MKTPERHGNRIAFTLLVLAWAVIGCTQREIPVQRPVQVGEYGPVSRDQLLGQQTCTALGDPERKFVWAFAEERFELQEADRPIPPEVVEGILGQRRETRRIVGTWTLDDKMLRLADVRDDQMVAYPGVTLRLIQTPWLRLNFGDEQYLFAEE